MQLGFVSNQVFNVGLYIRLSKEDGDKEDDDDKNSESVLNQKSLLLNFCRENTLSVVDIYIDDGYTGLNFDRPEFNRMLDDIQSKRINMVITKDLSRLRA